MIHLYRTLNVHFSAPETEILLALARYIYEKKDQADPQIIAQTKEYLLNDAVRVIYNKQLLEEYPDTDTSDYTPIPLDDIFSIQDKAAFLQELSMAMNEMKAMNNVLENRIKELRSEEKIYRFPIHSREFLNVNYQLFTRSIINEKAKTVFFSTMHILVRHKRPVRYLLYSESQGYSYIRYYEYVILKCKLNGNKKYLLSRASVEALNAAGIFNVEPTTAAEGAIYASRILIDIKNPLFLEEAAIDHMVEETLALYDHAAESIRTFNEAAIRIKQHTVEDLLNSKAANSAAKDIDSANLDN